VDRARSFLEIEMAAGELRPHDPRLLILSAYSTVIGVATEVEVLRAVGIEPTARSLIRRRNELLAFLRSALVPD
jgi:TetR/AcrR family transcriptional regulator